MRLPVIAEERHSDIPAPSLVIGALAGLAIGVLLSRGLSLPPLRGRRGDELGERAKQATRRLRPARLYRLAAEQEELDILEDTVLQRFLSDELLRDRAIDIGAISPGILELSGTVRSEEEADRAVSLANGIDGVQTVVNRLDVGGGQARSGLRRQLDANDIASTFTRQEARVGGMGRRRQDPATDPDRRDDSQKLRERALAAADRAQVRDEDLGDATAQSGSPPEPRRANRTKFREDQLDNQDPHGKHADATLDEQPQELNSDARVGQRSKPGGTRRKDAEVPFEEPPRDK